MSTSMSLEHVGVRAVTATMPTIQRPGSPARTRDAVHRGETPAADAYGTDFTSAPFVMKPLVFWQSCTAIALVASACSTRKDSECRVGECAEFGSGVPSNESANEVRGGATSRDSNNNVSQPVTGAGRATNPYGVFYPTSGIGRRPRQGSQPGDVIENLQFSGYAAGDISSGLRTISMVDYFDPNTKKYKIVVVAGTSNACPYCQKEADDVASMREQFQSDKVAFLNAVLEGSKQTASTKSDLDAWVKTRHANFPAFLDPGGEKLARYGLSAYPLNIVIDARSMEILAVVSGDPTDGIQALAKTYAKWVDTHAPRP